MIMLAESLLTKMELASNTKGGSDETYYLVTIAYITFHYTLCNGYSLFRPSGDGGRKSH